MAEVLLIILKERRYFESLENLSNIISICDEINIYDNTDIFKLIMCIQQGKVVWKDDILPDWIKSIIN